MNQTLSPQQSIDALDHRELPDEIVLKREVARIDDQGFIAGYVPGHVARHLIPGKEPAFTDPFLVLAEDWMPRGTFEMHPHRGIETVTLVLEGSVVHHDSAGNRGVIHAGDAQWVTFGRGIWHQEDPPKRTTAHLLQLWINLPTDQKMTSPRYQDLLASEVPQRRGPGFEAKVFSGRSGQVTSSTLNHVPVTMIDARIQADCSFTQELPAFDNAFVYVINGVVEIGTDPTRVTGGQLAWLKRSEGPGRSEVTLTAGEKGCRVLILSGRPLKEPVVFGGPFVMNTSEQIREAFDEYYRGRL